MSSENRLSNSIERQSSMSLEVDGGKGSQWTALLNRYRVPALLTALVLGVVLMTAPNVPSSSEVDLSFSDVLNYAHEHQWQCGTQIATTHGPLGWLYFPHYFSRSGLAQLTTQFGIAVVGLCGLCMIAWRFRILQRCGFLAAFTWAAANISFRTDLLVETGLLCWGLLCFVESGAELVCAVAGFVIFGSFVSLAKVSFLFISLSSLVIIGLDLTLRRRTRLALGLVFGYSAAFLMGWLACRQNILHLWPFLIRAAQAVQGYDQAVGLEGLVALRQISFALALLLWVVIALRSLVAFQNEAIRLRWRRVLMLSWLSLLLLASWKHGFIRLDRVHASLFLVFASVLAVVSDVPVTNSSAMRVWLMALALICAVSCLMLLQGFFLPPIPGSFRQPFYEFQANLERLFHPLRFKTASDQLRAAVREEYQLPGCGGIVGREAVDVFGQYQSFALDNDFNYCPRPIFQSYYSCNRSLMEYNHDFYASGHAPPFLLFDLKAMDDKLPPLEDAWLLRYVLVNYQPVLSEKRFVLLKKKSTEIPKLNLIKEGTVHFGEKIDLQPYPGDSIWLEFNLVPTFRGHTRRMLFAPPVLRLAAWNDSGKLISRRRAPETFLSAGFLASPLLLQTLDLQRLFEVPRSACYPAAYSVEAAPGQESLWRNVVHFRLYTIENRVGLGRSEPATSR